MTRQNILAAIALVAVGLLGGCVAYPAYPTYPSYGYAQPAPYYVGGPVVVAGGGWHEGGWHEGGWGWRH